MIFQGYFPRADLITWFLEKDPFPGGKIILPLKFRHESAILGGEMGTVLDENIIEKGGKSDANKLERTCSKYS
ncbi:MAG: hypothetical protein NTX75_13025 [Proteobacteria bacterium]|nr:hypothetical protein [Pseudomonadota bacterium]